MAPIDPTWFGVILAAIFSIVQLIYQAGSGGGCVNVIESHFHLLKKTVSLYASISLITLTSCKPLPTPMSHKISLLFAILALAAPLSAAVPYELWWLPYLSCTRLLFDVLRDVYLFCTNMPSEPFWELCHSIGNAAYQFNLKAHQFIQHLVPINLGTNSTQTNSNSEGAMRNITNEL